MIFREQATLDEPTFLNVDEFGEPLVIDGVPVVCVVEGNGDTRATEDGVVNVDTLLYARVSSFDRLPVVNQRITIDDRQANVVGVNEEQGIVEIRLRWWDS